VGYESDSVGWSANKGLEWGSRAYVRYSSDLTFLHRRELSSLTTWLYSLSSSTTAREQLQEPVPSCTVRTLQSCYPNTVPISPTSKLVKLPPVPTRIPPMMSDHRSPGDGEELSVLHKRKRANLACVSCRERKIRCNAMVNYPGPCTNCALDQAPCTMAPRV
jgi:Fungal Zn(2)-Cys(6) binuclear cluster domain